MPSNHGRDFITELMIDCKKQKKNNQDTLPLQSIFLQKICQPVICPLILIKSRAGRSTIFNRSNKTAVFSAMCQMPEINCFFFSYIDTVHVQFVFALVRVIDFFPNYCAKGLCCGCCS